MNIKEERVFDGHFKVERYTIEDNDTTYIRDVCVSKDAVFVLPVDLINRKIILVKEKRFGLVPHNIPLEMWSSVAGTLDKDSASAEDIALMEIHEEIGVNPKEAHGFLTKLADHYSSPGIISEKKTIFFYDFDIAHFKNGTYGNEHENESIEAQVFDFEDVEIMIQNGQVPDLNCMYAFNIIKSYQSVFSPEPPTDKIPF